MPTFSNVHLALQALLTHQQAIEVTEHNVANAATPGYHRQEAVLRAGPVQGAPGLQASTISGMVGTGVIMERVRRYSLEFSDMRYRAELAETKKWEIEAQFLQQVEGAMAELGDTGLNAKLDELWSAWKAASTDPSDMTTRADLLEKAKSLAGAFSSRIDSLQALQRDKNMALIQRVEEVNELSEQIARLNVEIGRYNTPGTQANDFMDERDMLLDRLAEITGAKVYFEDNGQAMVSIGGHVLVQGASTHELVTTPEPTNFNLVDITWDDGSAFTAGGGEIAGLLDARDVVIGEQKQQLDNLATEIAEQVNGIHRTGYGLNESIVYDSANPPLGALRDFFVISDPLHNPAQSFRVNSDLEDLSLISLSQIDVPAGAVNGDTLAAASGDGRIAEQIFSLQYEAVTFGDGKVDTINHYNSLRVSDLGLTIKRVNTLSSQHNNLLTVLNEQRESVSGVNLDEEAANLMKFQRSYQAAVRLMTAVDEMMEQIVSRLGLVGR